MVIQDYCIGLKGVTNAIHRVTRALSGNVNSTTISDAVEEVAIAIENGGGGGGGGTTDHTKLQNRDSADQHPISAITGLEAALNEKADTSSTYTKTEQQYKNRRYAHFTGLSPVYFISLFFFYFFYPYLYYSR